MNQDPVADPDSVDNEAFALYLQAREEGLAVQADRILGEHPQLAEEFAVFLAVQARVPRPWRAAGADGLRSVGDFELLQELGRGGMGVVYRAEQKMLKRQVAVKVLRHFPDSEDTCRFRREIQQLAALCHPNIVQIHHAGECDERPYFAMELLDGGSLARKLAEGWLPAPRQAAELCRVLAEALQYAHENGIVHRDLKPANVLLQSLPHSDASALPFVPKIGDFGLARRLASPAAKAAGFGDDEVKAGSFDCESLTVTGAVIGTASYMAPEQAAGDSNKAGPAADVYSLGAILYQLLTGRPPFVGATMILTLEQVREQEPLPVRQLAPNVARELETICFKCLHKNPLDRYASAVDLAEDLRQFLLNGPIQARPQTFFERLTRAVRQPGLMADFHAYGTSYFLAGLIVASSHLAVYVTMVCHAADWLTWSALLLPYVFLFAIFRRHRYPWNTVAGWVDRSLWSIWTGHFLAGFTVLIAFYLSAADMRETLRFGYPMLAALTGLAFFMMGADHWGRYYLFGLLWWAATIPMALVPVGAPLIVAFLAACCLWQIAWFMRKQSGHREKPK